jgi:hypothetical protein
VWNSGVTVAAYQTWNKGGAHPSTFATGQVV